MAEDNYGVTSPGGFIFGVQGWTWGDPRPTSITFFLDNTAKVSDQHGRPIKGTSVDGKEVRFARTPPANDEQPGSRANLATHLQVVEALAAERIDWRSLTRSGWPQLPYAMLKELDPLPPTPDEELRKIRNPQLRKDALRIRREADEARAAEEIAATADV